MSDHLQVTNGGLMTTVQDLGRFGHQAIGIPTAGALDPDALRLANALVGNRQDMAGLEIRNLGPTLKVEAESVRVALAGTTAPLQIAGPPPRTVSALQSVRLERGQVFSVGATGDTACCYLAIEGGFDIPFVLGSQSTYLPGAFGGIEGRPLRNGDRLPLTRPGVALRHECAAAANELGPFDGRIRVILGPQDDYFTEAGRQAFLGSDYTVSRYADRMGVRLDGPIIEHAKGYNITSDGIAPGSIQVPGTGQPIVLLADRQTTGGYPKIATVISADLPLLGRMRPGEKLRFEAISVAEAEQARHARERKLKQLIDTIQQLPDDAALLEQRLRTANLISGVVAD